MAEFAQANERPVQGAWRDEGGTKISHPKMDASEETREHKPIVLLVDQLGFNIFVSVLVLVNTLLVGIEQDLVSNSADVNDRIVWYMLGLVISVVFLVEIGLRIYCLRRKFFEDLWDVLDLVLVVGSVIDVFLLTPLGSGGRIRAFSTIRTLRVIKLVRLVRVFPAFRELWLLVGGLINSIKALGWVGIVLACVLYVCSIFVTTEVGQNTLFESGPSYDGEVWPYREYFGTVPRSMFTLFQVMTLDGWCDDIVRHIVFFQPMMAPFFVLFILLTALGLMNVVVGIIVENTLAAAQVADTRHEQHQAELRDKAIDELCKLLELSDTNRTGEISQKELAAVAQSKAVMRQFKRLGIKLEEAEELFKLLDYEGRGKVQLKRFILACRELVGGAKRRDIVQVEITVGTLAQRLDSLDGKFSDIENEVAQLGQMADDFLAKTVNAITGFDGTGFNLKPHA